MYIVLAHLLAVLQAVQGVVGAGCRAHLYPRITVAPKGGKTERKQKKQAGRAEDNKSEYKSRQACGCYMRRTRVHDVAPKTKRAKINQQNKK